MDPGASLGLGDARLRFPSLHEIRKHCDPLLKQHQFPADQAALDADLDELITLQGLRGSTQIADCTPGRERLPLSVFLTTRPGVPGGFGDQHKVGGQAFTPAPIWPAGLRTTRPCSAAGWPSTTCW